MRAETSEILADPVFELNLTLWMLQQLPGVASIRPVLREAGYTLDSISRPLPFPFAMRPAVAAVAGSHDAPSPDVLAAGPTPAEWLIVECKGAAFGSESSNARQATKLLLIAPDLTEPLALPAGEARPGHVVFLTRAEDREAMAATLEELRGRFAEKGVSAGESGVLGLSGENDGVYVERSATGSWPASIARLLSGPTRVLKLEKDEDPRPLYFIPWDPGVQQQAEMREHCKSILFTRIATEATSQVGRSEIPTRIQLVAHQLLARATYGMSDRWRSRGDVKSVLRECKRFLGAALQPLKERLALSMLFDPERLEFTLHSEDDRDAAIDALLKANPQEPPSVEDENQMALFSE